MTRYFGGVLLGTGGLVRAYQGALQAALQNCLIGEKRTGLPVTLELPYTDLGRIQYTLAEHKVPVRSIDYAENVRISCLFPLGEKEDLTRRLADASGGRAVLTLGDETEYGIVEGEVVEL